MRVPVPLAEAFGEPFEKFIASFAAEQGLLPEADALFSQRFLTRSVAPHIVSLSRMFNRLSPSPHPEKTEGTEESPLVLDNYWGKVSSNRKNLRLAYFLYFMPANLMRTASVWSELSRLGFEWKASGALKGVDFGAGPAAGPTGICLAESITPVGLPGEGNWALIEADKPMLQIGSRWAEAFFGWNGCAPPGGSAAGARENPAKNWEVRPYPRKLDLKRGFLPPGAPKFHLWLMSYFLNELDQTPKDIARALADAWDRHLEEEGIAILVEPALRVESRKLLEIRDELIELSQRRGYGWLKVLLPCLGHQACGALAKADDWCHEEVTWWRPGYYRAIDKLAGLDRRSLPFTYFVVSRSERSVEEILPATAPSAQGRYRLVSPSHFEGSDLDFFVCGPDGKYRARIRRAERESAGIEQPGRGDILTGVQFQESRDRDTSPEAAEPPGSNGPAASRRRIQKLKKRL